MISNRLWTSIGVTRSYSSRPFLCALVWVQSLVSKITTCETMSSCFVGVLEAIKQFCATNPAAAAAADVTKPLPSLAEPGCGHARLVPWIVCKAILHLETRQACRLLGDKSSDCNGFGKKPSWWLYVGSQSHNESGSGCEGSSEHSHAQLTGTNSYMSSEDFITTAASLESTDCFHCTYELLDMVSKIIVFFQDNCIHENLPRWLYSWILGTDLLFQNYCFTIRFSLVLMCSDQ